MKNLGLKLVLLLFAGTICSFQSPKPTLQEIFQTTLDIEVLEEHFNKNSQGELLPLTIVSNNYIATDIPLSFAKNKVVIKSNLAEKASDDLSVLEITEIKMNGKKSKLSFNYDDKTIKVRLKKEGSEWTAKTVSVKWKNGFDTTIVSSKEIHF